MEMQCTRRLDLDLKRFLALRLTWEEAPGKSGSRCNWGYWGTWGLWARAALCVGPGTEESPGQGEVLALLPLLSSPPQGPEGAAFAWTLAWSAGVLSLQGSGSG